MMKIFSLVVTVGLSIGTVNCQGGTTANGNYVCVLPGTCPTTPSNPSGIDPRIVTPTTDTLCPVGMVPCFGVGTVIGCGARFITPTNTADGQADYGAYPWQAYLSNTTHTFAGSGVLLDNYHVLTAAHKVAGNVANPSAVTVVMGVYNPTNLTGTQSSVVSRIKLHEMYNPSTLKNDIALLRLTTPIVIGIQNNVNRACLPAAGSTYVGSTCVVSGWGQTAFSVANAPTNPMKQVNVRIVDYATCRTSYSNASLLGTNVDVYLDQAGEICAGGEALKDACTQDGGSPLVCASSTGQYNVAGLVIWGKNCGLANVYGVYVSVPAYRNWIDTNIATFNAVG